MSAPGEIAVVRDAAPAADAWHAVVAAARAADLPGVPAPVREEILAGLRGDAHAGAGVAPAWAATATGGEVTAVAGVRPSTPPGPGRATAELQLYVHPDARRRGTGTLLLAAVVAAARDEGWDTLRAAAPACTPADVFCLRHGFVRDRVVHHLLVPLAEVHRAWLAELVFADHPGYRLTTWYAPPTAPAAGTAPSRTEAARETAGPGDLAAAVPGIAFGTAGAPGPRHGRLLTVAAVHTGTGTVAGYTEVLVPPAPAPRAQHCHTAVVPAHRRRGLGRWLTAEMLRRLHAEHPQIAEVETAAADGDTAVLALAEQLGFRPYRRTHTYRLHVRR